MPAQLTFPIQSVRKIMQESKASLKLVRDDNAIFLISDKPGQVDAVYAHGYDPNKNGEYTVRRRVNNMSPQPMMLELACNLFRDVFHPRAAVVIIDFHSRNNFKVGVA